MTERSQFTCIYCCRSEPDVAPSKAHIFPDVVGGITSQRDKVCATCNHEINRQIEMPLLPSFTFFRSIWGIKGRKGDIPVVPGTVRFAGQEARVSINNRGEIDHAIILRETDAQGKSTYLIFGLADKVEEGQRSVDKKKSGLSWTQMEKGQPPEITADVGEFDLLGNLRRLSTKIAFESFAYFKFDVLSSDFDLVREFIQTGKDPSVLCGVLPDPRRVNFIGNLLQYPLPNHWVTIVTSPRSSVLGGIVSLFGVFFYWTILSRRYTALASFDKLLIEFPTTGKVSKPVLRGRLGNLVVDWDRMAAEYRSDPAAAARRAGSYALERLKLAFSQTQSL